MPAALSFAFLAGASVTAFAVLWANLMSVRPASPREHMKALARFGIFVACVVSAARILQTGTEVTWERALLMVSLALLYVAQVRIQAVRHAADDETDQAGA